MLTKYSSSTSFFTKLGVPLISGGITLVILTLLFKKGSLAAGITLGIVGLISLAYGLIKTRKNSPTATDKNNQQ